MKVGLWSDCHNFPSLPLMKISAYHKSRGDTVDFAMPLDYYDVVYASKTFSFTPDLDADGIIHADEIKRAVQAIAYPLKMVERFLTAVKINHCRLESSIYILIIAYIHNINLLQGF